MKCFPVPEARYTHCHIPKFLLFAFALLDGRSLARIRNERNIVGEIQKIRYVTRYEEEVNHVQSCRIVLFTGDRAFTATLSGRAALLFFENLVNGSEISLCFSTFDRRSSEAKTTRECRRNKVAFNAQVCAI